MSRMADGAVNGTAAAAANNRQRPYTPLAGSQTRTHIHVRVHVQIVGSAAGETTRLGRFLAVVVTRHAPVLPFPNHHATDIKLFKSFSPCCPCCCRHPVPHRSQLPNPCSAALLSIASSRHHVC